MNKLSILSIIIALIALVYAFTIPRNNATVNEETTYEHVMRTQTIRCGYTSYSVALFKDKNGQLQGIYKDLMDEVGKLLSLKVSWAEEIGWGEQIAGLNTNRYDMVCSPANMTGPRAKAADFVTPFYYSPVYAWARKDDARFSADSKTNLKRANNADIKIATIDGEQSEAQATQYFPKARLLSAPQSAPFTTMFINVTTNKADITIAEPVVMRTFLEKNPEQALVPINIDDPLILAVNIMMVKSGDPQWKAMISNAMTILIANGVVDRILDRWEPYPNSYIRAPRVK